MLRRYVVILLLLCMGPFIPARAFADTLPTAVGSVWSVVDRVVGGWVVLLMEPTEQECAVPITALRTLPEGYEIQPGHWGRLHATEFRECSLVEAGTVKFIYDEALTQKRHGYIFEKLEALRRRTPISP